MFWLIGAKNQNMKTKSIIQMAAAAMLGCFTAAVDTRAQSSDALLNKLVEKGVLTQEEASNLRKETTNDFNRAFNAKTGMPTWVNRVTFGGDFRGRYDGSYQDDSNTGPSSATQDRQQFRYRLRYGLVASLADQFEVGLRLGFGTGDGWDGDRMAAGMVRW